jgi:pectin methylesterase-like acyl-CoA thioesterase
MEGGFENQPAGTVSTAAPTGAVNPSPTVWTTGGSANIVNDGTARTGINYFTYTSTSTSTKNNFAPAVATPLFTNGTKYIVQFFYRAPAPSAGNQMSGLIAVTDNSGATNFTTNYTYQTPVNTNGGWLKFTGIQSVNPAYTPTTSLGGFRFNGGGTAIAKPFDIDDFVVYPADNQASPSPDATAPDAATSPAATGNASSIEVSWTAPATGVDGGGYMVVRSSTATPPVLNANGIYSAGHNIGSGNIVVYIGTGAAFTDDGTVAPLTAGITYYYHIFTADKAFNYSTAVSVSGSTAATGPVVAVSGTLNSFTQTVGTPAASQSFTVHGSNLTASVQVTAPAGFELSEDNNSWSPSLNLAHQNNTVNAIAFVRLNAANAGSYSGNITVASSGATDAALTVNGMATNPVPAGYDVVVAQDGSGNYTSLQAAINAAPSNRTTPYRILVRKGKYVEKVTIPASKPFLYVIGEGINDVVFSWDDYAGKPGVTEIATITINSNDCLFMNLTVENSWGRKNDGPQALAVKATGDRIIFKNCKMVSGQDTVMAHGNGKRQYFRNCYIDGNTDYIYGSAIAVFDSCVLFNRDRVDGSTSSVFTAASTPAGQTYGYVFRDCLLPNNNGQTAYTLGRPWGNSEPPHTSETKVVFLNCRMGTTV